MAADTAQKRISAMNLKCPWRRSGVIPDGTIDQGDRQAAFRMYSGILAGAVLISELIHRRISISNIQVGL